MKCGKYASESAFIEVARRYSAPLVEEDGHVPGLHKVHIEQWIEDRAYATFGEALKPLFDD